MGPVNTRYWQIIVAPGPTGPVITIIVGNLVLRCPHGGITRRHPLILVFSTKTRQHVRKMDRADHQKHKKQQKRAQDGHPERVIVLILIIILRKQDGL